MNTLRDRWDSLPRFVRAALTLLGTLVFVGLGYRAIHEPDAATRDTVVEAHKAASPHERKEENR